MLFSQNAEKFRPSARGGPTTSRVEGENGPSGTKGKWRTEGKGGGGESWTGRASLAWLRESRYYDNNDYVDDGDGEDGNDDNDEEKKEGEVKDDDQRPGEEKHFDKEKRGRRRK